jgi:hypothetical protein
MKRAVLLFLLLAMIAVSAGANYTIQLTSGKVITADNKPIIKDGMAYFNKSGIYFYIPAAQIDIPVSERLNSLEAPAATAPTGSAPAGPAVKPVFVGEEQLDVIRARSRLANEGQLQGSTAPATAAPTGGETPSSAPSRGSAANRNGLQSQLVGLIDKQSGYQKELSSVQNQLAALKESYNSSAQQNDKEKIQQQIDTLSANMQDVQNNLSSTQGEIQQIQQQLSSAPITIEGPPPGEGGAPKPPPKNLEEGPGT